MFKASVCRGSRLPDSQGAEPRLAGGDVTQYFDLRLDETTR